VFLVILISTINQAYHMTNYD